MARPRKQGLSYFPHDVDAVDDPKVSSLRTMFGNDGYAFYFIMLEQAYKTEDGRLRSHADSASAASSILQDKMFRCFHARNCGITPETWDEILTYAVGIGLFEEGAWVEFKHLTSSGIQRRLGMVTEERERKRKGKGKERKVNASRIVPTETQGETPEEPRKNPGETEDAYPPAFEAWWKRYPHKAAKEDALGAWKARLREGRTPEELGKALDNYLVDLATLGTEEQYIKRGATFLGKRKGFLDYLPGTWKPAPAGGNGKRNLTMDEKYPRVITEAMKREGRMVPTQQELQEAGLA